MSINKNPPKFNVTAQQQTFTALSASCAYTDIDIKGQSAKRKVNFSKSSQGKFLDGKASSNYMLFTVTANVTKINSAQVHNP